MSDARQYKARSDGNAKLAAQVHALAAKHPRSGYRRVHALLRRTQRVTKQRILRLWKRAKLQVRQYSRTRRCIVRTELPVNATYPGHVWTSDFTDHSQHGTLLRILSVMDECTCEGLAIEVAPSIPATRGIALLERLVVAHGPPTFIRRDHGLEFGSRTLGGWFAR